MNVHDLNTPGAGFPSALLEQRRWCCWKKQPKSGGGFTKPPIDPNTGRPVNIRERANLLTYAEAMQALANGCGDGIGIATGDFDGLPLCGIDLDNVLDDAGITPPEWREAVKTVAQSGYCELSPSGHGVRGLALCRKPEGYRHKTNVNGHDVEVRFDGQYMTLTGNRPTWCTQPLSENDAAVKHLCERYLKQGGELDWNSTINDRRPTGGEQPRDLLNVGLEKDKAFAALWNGERPNGNESSDDLALMNKLAYWCSKDQGAMIEAFKASPHAQGKDEAHRKKMERKDYLPSTAAAAIISTTDTARESNECFRESRSARKDFEGIITPKPRLIRACDIPYEPPRWLIPPYFQRGKGTLVQADNGTGKTAFSCAIAAHVSNGTPLLSSPVETPGNVVMISVEDDLPVLRGRVEADGGRLDRILFVSDAGGLTFNSPEVEQFIRDTQAKLIVFDPIQCFLGADIDMHRANETRPALAKFFDMCARNDCSALIVSHLGKEVSGKSAVNRALGSVDIPAAMRSILQITPNPDVTGENIVFHVKCSNAPKGRSIAYTIGDLGKVEWVGYTDMTMEDLNVIQKRNQSSLPYEKEPLVQVFRQLITDKPGGGFWSYAELKETGMRILGFPPFSSTADLKAKLDGPLAKELQQKDGMIITCGHRNKYARGVRIEQYKAPGDYQSKING